MDTSGERKNPESSAKPGQAKQGASKPDSKRIPDRKRPSFLSDLRDRKKFNPGKSKVVGGGVPHGHQVVEVAYEGSKNAISSAFETGNGVAADEVLRAANPEEGPVRQVNWLAVGSRDSSAALLSRNNETKQRKANLAMRYGW